MSSFLTSKKFLLVLAVIAASFVAYVYFLKPDSTPEPAVVSEGGDSEKLAAGKEILTLLVDLRSLKLDDSIFKSKAFQALEDFSLPVEPEPQGRVNPFAPIGQESVSPVSTTSPETGEGRVPGLGASAAGN